MMTKNFNSHTERMQRCHEYVEALEEEQKKIQVFQRELPLCFELVTKAIESCRKELSGSSTSEHVHGQSECSERTTSECGGGGAAVFEEFIPMKWTSSSSDEHESCETVKDDGAEKIASESNGGDKKKSDWLRSVQLWNQSPDPQDEQDQTTIVEVKRNGGAFQPFLKEKSVVAAAAKDDSQPLNAITPTPTPTTSNSTAETQRESEQHKHSQMLRKQRRCWSPELHRRFLHALQQLGGSHAATPKQIRDLMKVDGLTNDEVKSHLQKYRLHTRRPATPAAVTGVENPQQPQFMVVEGIWLPSQDASNNRVYAPVAAQPSGERSGRRCKSPNSSTHTPHLRGLKF
ncbi:unnamed protein product [Microthlaspi erraticum]|uniref:HTH myb-type domain-containing protein n=1 Tax=Microthlaspi erraticum TaxID=1685480 RepID=A0A6D2J988_9BRAS|nr:unnamed protein product [Microthlaspi erraticum]